MQPEQRSIKAGSQLIFHMIYSQAGSLEKALAEYVMNSADAGATEASLDLDPNGFTFSDDGNGFKSRAEIEEFFEQLAFNHVDGDRKFWVYGLGRAQSFAWAATKWRTGEFLMDVDIKHRGLDYLLTSNLGKVGGCKIEGQFYELLLPSDIENVRRNLVELVQYAPIPVRINGAVVNKDPENEKWDLETDDAYIRLRATGDLLVYNQGILAKKFSGREYGTGGTVVSKNALTLNVARNDILLTKCKVWPRIRKHLIDVGAEKTKKNTKLRDHERQFLASRLVTNEETYDKACDIRFIPDIKGRMMSLEQLAKHKCFTIAPEAGSRVGERVLEQKLALVLDPTVLELFHCDTAQELADWLREMSAYPRRPTWSRIDLASQPFEQFEDLISETHVLLESSVLNVKERAALTALTGAANWKLSMNLFREIGLQERQNRILHAGSSESADAWTDGKTMIAINRPLLKLADRGVTGFIDLMNLLAHEYTHDESDVASHEHDHDFYQSYHDLTSIHGPGGLSSMALKAATAYAGMIQREGKKLSHSQLRDADRELIVERSEPGL